MARTQMQFAHYFAALMLRKAPDAVDEDGRPAPAYQINALTHYGAFVGLRVAVDYPLQQPI
jgi:hypothetical protein